MGMGGRNSNLGGGFGGYQPAPYSMGPSSPGKGQIRPPFAQQPYGGGFGGGFGGYQPPMYGGGFGGGFGGYQPPMYGGGGYSSGPGKGRASSGIPSQNAYYDENRISKLTKEDPYGLIPYKEPVQTPPPATAPPAPPPPTQTEQVPSRPTRGLAGFGPQAEGFPRGMPTFTPPTPPQQDPNFVYQPPSWLGDELAASTSTNPVSEAMTQQEIKDFNDPSSGRYCPRPEEHIQLANNDWILAGNLKVGDEVVTSENPEKVTRVERIESSPRCEVLFEDSDSIVTSYGHPYFVNNKGFVEVSDLEKGDQVGDLVVKDKKPFSDGPVISLSVDKAETYMLKGGTKDSPVPALSHNKSMPRGPEMYDPSNPRTMEKWKNNRDSTRWILPGTEAWQKWDERKQRREQSGYIAPEMQSLNTGTQGLLGADMKLPTQRGFNPQQQALAPLAPMTMQPSFYGSPGKGMRPQPYGGGFGGYQPSPYGGGYSPQSMLSGIGSLQSNYSPYMPQMRGFNPYMR